MTINITTFQNALQAKLNNAVSTDDGTDFAVLAKAVKELNSTVTSSYANSAALPAAGDYQGRIVHVVDTNRIYYSDGSTWVILATSQDPDFTQSLLNAETVTSSDYGNIADAVGTSLDYGAVTGSVDISSDYGVLRIASKGIAGDIYLDPSDWTFTIYDGETRDGIKHLRADKNNPNFRTMGANSQGIAHIVKTSNTLLSLGTPTAVPFNVTRVNDTRMGYLDGSGNYFCKYEGWYQVQFDGWINQPGFVGLGISGDYNTGTEFASQGPDEYTMQHITSSGIFSAIRVIYVPINTSIVLYGIGPNASTNTYIYGAAGSSVLTVNSAYRYYTQMNIKFLGSNTTTESYKVSV